MALICKSKKDLKNEYQVTWPTLRKWLLKVPDLQLNPRKQIFTPLELQKIYIHLGRPE